MSPALFIHIIDSSEHNPLLYNSIRFSSPEKFRYMVVSLGKEGPLKQQVESAGAEFLAFDLLDKRKYLRIFFRLYRLFRKTKPRYVQTHLFKSSLMGLSAARLAAVPVRIFTGHHSHEVPLYHRPLLTWVDGLNGRWLSNHSIAPSEDMKEIFMRYQKIPERKIAVIPHGFDLLAWRQKAEHEADLRKELGLEGKFIFGATGRLFWVKNFPFLIRSFSRFAQTGNDAVLLIAGDGNDRDELTRLVRELNMNDRILFLGRRADMGGVMKSFDVFVHPSLAESFGMVYIEAFALGIPAISSKVGIAREIIRQGENGWLIDSKDEESLCQAMKQAYEQQGRWSAVKNELRTIADGFDVRITQATCDDLYDQWYKK